MEKLDLEKLKFPIEKFEAPTAYTSEYISDKIAEIESFPKRLRKETFHLSDEQLDTTYRPGGWTVRQLIHHCGESHMNCFIRIKWALTENNPIIKLYDENLWSALPDNLQMPIEASLSLLEGLHSRLTFLMKNLSEEEFEKSFINPENNFEYKIKEIIGLYAWHGNHHLAHIIALKKHKNWQ